MTKEEIHQLVNDTVANLKVLDSLVTYFHDNIVDRTSYEDRYHYLYLSMTSNTIYNTIPLLVDFEKGNFVNITDIPDDSIKPKTYPTSSKR